MQIASPITSLRRVPRRRVGAAAARPVTLALQGGGALGAFTWGALDRLLEEPRLRVAAASGASAGAMNAAMLVQGLATGGPEEAKRLLDAFWRRVAVAAAGSPERTLGQGRSSIGQTSVPVSSVMPARRW